MKFFTTRKKIVATISTVALAASLGGVAFAYFTSSGAGNGTATTGSASAWTVSVTGDNSTKDLTPVHAIGTGPSDTESYTITNASSGQQLLNQAVITVASVTAGPVSGPNACTASDFSVGGALVGLPFTQTIAANEAAAAVYPNTVSLQLVDNGLNQDQCQGAVVTLHVAAS